MSQIVLHVSEIEILLIPNDLVSRLLHELLLCKVVLAELMFFRIDSKEIVSDCIEIGVWVVDLMEVEYVCEGLGHNFISY